MIAFLSRLLRSPFVRKTNTAPAESFAQLEALRQEFFVIAEHLTAPRNLIQFYTRRQDDGAYHLEVVGDEYHYISTERGKTLNVRITRDPKEVLFWLTENLTKLMASEYELNHRVERQDSRRLRFAKHVELMESIDHLWAERVADKYESILVKHPFDDRSLAE